MFVQLIRSLTFQLRRQSKYETEDEETEEERGLKWDQAISTGTLKGKNHSQWLNPLGADVLLRGEWKGKACGGSLNHLTWINNPQIFLCVNQESTINISLFQPKSDKKLSISFYVFRTQSPLCSYFCNCVSLIKVGDWLEVTTSQILFAKLTFLL